MIAPDRTTALPRHDELPGLACREQTLLAEALESLFHQPALDTLVSRTLGYPDWPQPLTLLPTIAPELVTATPQLARYLAFAIPAARQALHLVEEAGWPVDPGASDATWMLLQHADADNDRRRAVLPAVADATRSGEADPRQLALLTDREHVVRGEPQRYGTLRLMRDLHEILIYPLAGSHADVDVNRRAIGMATLDEDSPYAYTPISPFGVGRTTSLNPWLYGTLGTLRPAPAIARPVDPAARPPSGRVGVYLATNVRYRNQLRQFRDRLPDLLVSTSRWLDIDPLTRTSCQIDAGPALNQLAARICLTDIARSQALIAFTNERRSHGVGVEIGAGLALGKPVILIGPPRCSFDMLPGVTIVDSPTDAVEIACQLAARTSNAR